LKGKKYCDWKINIENKEFKLHKALLDIRCPKLLQYCTLDTSIAAFQLFCTFLYTNSFKQDKQTKMDLSLKTWNELNQLSKYLEQKEIEFLSFQIITLLSNNHHESICFNDNDKRSNEIEIRSLESIMEEMYKRKNNVDYSIIVHGKEMKIHKFIVASQWDFFESILLREQTHNPEQIPFQTFQNLIYYYYVHNYKHFCLEDCARLLSMSQYYGLHQTLIEYCDNYFNQEIEKADWEQVMNLGIELDNQEIKTKALSLKQGICFLFFLFITPKSFTN
jgi:hypothetical protein